jgi:cell division septal protein FtsQ
MGKKPERGEGMKWGKLTGISSGKAKARSRRVRHVLAAKMSARGKRQAMGQRVGIMLLLVGSVISLLVIGMITSAGMDKLFEKLLYQNSDFTLRRFQIEPANKIGKGELVAASGVRIGQNLLQVSLDEVRDSIQKLPTVASVRVERRLPDTLYFYIEERRPVALLCPTPTTGTQLAQPMYYIDSRGYVLKPKPGEKLISLPTIRGVSSDEVVEGEQTANPDLRAALVFLREAPLAPVRDGLDCSGLVLEGPGRFLVSTPRGGKIRFRTSCLLEQFDRLGVIFDYAESKGRIVNTVDLTPERNVPVTFLN